MDNFKRRDFLKAITAAAAVPAVLKATTTVATEPSPPLPDIPTCASMRSITMTHKFLDLYAWPGLTNQWG
ncbi:MAG: hypothetical protein ABIR33_06735, partial [Pyrinomonadaceae bacterium]